MKLVLKTALEAIDKGDEATAREQAVLLRAAGFTAGQHVGDPSCANTPTTCREYVAGQVLHIVDVEAWHAMNILLNLCTGPWAKALDL
jgi:hypothetical protein